MARPLPPSDRDLEVYESVCVAGRSLRAAAVLHNLSVTRIRQLVKRVVAWLADTLPPETDLDRQKQVQLARHIAADQLQFARCELMDLWRQTQNASFLLKTTRLTLSAARLGVVPGTIDGLVADAWEAAGIDIDALEDSERGVGLWPARTDEEPIDAETAPLGCADVPLPPPDQTDRPPFLSPIKSEIRNPQSEIPPPPPYEDCALDNAEQPLETPNSLPANHPNSCAMNDLHCSPLTSVATGELAAAPCAPDQNPIAPAPWPRPR